VSERRNYSFRVAWSQEDTGYIALSPEFPTLSSFGDTAIEAVAELQEAITGAIEVLEEAGDPVPPARALPHYSGQFRLRIPRSLHGQLVARAEAEGVSLNTLVHGYLAAGNRGADVAEANREELRRVEGVA